MIDYSHYYWNFRKSYKRMTSEERGEILCFLLYLHTRNIRVQEFESELRRYKVLTGITSEGILEKFVKATQEEVFV